MQIALCYPLTDNDLARLETAAARLDLQARFINAGQSGIAAALLEADLFIGHAKVPVDWQAVVERGRLQWIQSSAAGLDHCLTPPVIASPQIQVTSASGLFADQVAEQTMALLLGLIRGLPTFFRAQQDRSFERQPTDDLTGKTVAIIGWGGNGRRLAQVLAPWRVRILATDCFHDQPSQGLTELYPADALDAVLPQADIVVLCLPLNAQTEGLFDGTMLAKMRAGGILINVARGSIVREAALVDALESGQLAAAGLDVTEVEPLPNTSKLWDHPRVLITPHVGAQSARRVEITTRFAVENLERFVAGEPLWNRVDKRLGFPGPDARVPADVLERLLEPPQASR